jgi:hypothetical protein
MRRGGSAATVLVVGVGAIALAPAVATAAEPPVAITGAPTLVAPSTVTLTGTVNPRGAETSYVFRFGTTTLYGGQTAPASAGSGTRRVRVTVPLTGLAPATTYHYRLLASNRVGSARGEDRTFKTHRQPLGVTLAGTPNPVRTGASTTLTGALTGTGNVGRDVVLQANPFPYTQGFLNVANPQVTDARGGFAFPILAVPVNTQYRVLMPQRPEVVSPVVVVGTKVRVTTHVNVKRGVRRGRVRLSGSLTPAVDGTQVLIQKFVDELWTTIASTTAQHATASRSRYRKTLRQRRPGRYRVYVNAQGAHVPNLGTTVRVRHVRR